LGGENRSTKAPQNAALLKRGPKRGPKNPFNNPLSRIKNLGKGLKPPRPEKSRGKKLNPFKKTRKTPLS